MTYELRIESEKHTILRQLTKRSKDWAFKDITEIGKEMRQMNLIVENEDAESIIKTYKMKKV